MIKFLIEKEFKQILRNSFMPKIIIGMPLIMMILIPWAADQEIKDIHLSVVDHDHSSYSDRLVRKITASGYFLLTDISGTYKEAMESIESHQADMILEIPLNFEKDMMNGSSVQVLVAANAVNINKGGLGSSYLTSILNDFSSELREEQGAIVSAVTMPLINMIPNYRYNPLLDYQIYMVPAIMVILLTVLGGFIPALNIVSEKEIGTIEQMNVTPVSKVTFMVAKLIPCWIIGLIVFTICIIIAALIYRLTPYGSLFTIYLFACIYILTMSGAGLIISNYSSTMQQAMFVMFFFMMIFILMSGLFTPVSSMPEWAQKITIFNPLKYFIEAMRMLYLKGSRLWEMIPQLIALILFAIGFNIWAVISYRKKN